MRFTAMLRYDPSDPFTLKLGSELGAVGIHIDGVPTVIEGGRMQHVYLTTSLATLADVLESLAFVAGGDLLGVSIGEQ
jgi:hypothetical protein